jgi:hypothetical protein
MADLAFRLKLEPWEQTPLYLENKSMPELNELTVFPRAGKFARLRPHLGRRR